MTAVLPMESQEHQPEHVKSGQKDSDQSKGK